jgi:hypothetical protein
LARAARSRPGLARAAFRDGIWAVAALALCVENAPRARGERPFRWTGFRPPLRIEEIEVARCRRQSLRTGVDPSRRVDRSLGGDPGGASDLVCVTTGSSVSISQVQIRRGALLGEVAVARGVVGASLFGRGGTAARIRGRRRAGARCRGGDEDEDSLHLSSPLLGPWGRTGKPKTSAVNRSFRGPPVQGPRESRPRNAFSVAWSRPHEYKLATALTSRRFDT